MKALQNYLAPLLLMGLLISSSSLGSSDQKEVYYSFTSILFLYYHTICCLVVYELFRKVSLILSRIHPMTSECQEKQVHCKL